jgi:hypothetical protein
MKLSDDDKPQNLFTSIGAAVDQLDGETGPNPTEGGTANTTNTTTATDADANPDSAYTDPSRVVDEIESLCMNCHENGQTRLLLTRIPFFKEVILSSLE